MALSKITNGGVAASGIPSGGVVQVRQTQFTGTNTISTTSGSWNVMTDLTVNITPTSTSSTIMLQLFLGSWEHGNAEDHMAYFAFYRDSTLLVAPTAGSRLEIVGMGATNFYADDHLSTPAVAWINYFDTPSSTSQITYKGAMMALGTETFYLNRTAQDTDASGHERSISTIVATEIAG